MCRLVALVALVVLSGGLSGCGSSEPALHPTAGQVKLADGKPAVGCIVEFTSQAEGTKGMNARGEVQPDGSYQLKTIVNGKDKVGAVAGLQKVIVVGPPASSSGPVPFSIPQRYSDPAKSGLTFDVQPGASNNYPISLERN